MKLTKNIISREEAGKLVPEYVAYQDDKFSPDNRLWEQVFNACNALKRGQKVVTYTDGQYILAKVTSVNSRDFRAVDGPIVRVSNGEYSWRVDGNGYAYPVEVQK